MAEISPVTLGLHWPGGDKSEQKIIPIFEEPDANLGFCPIPSLASLEERIKFCCEASGSKLDIDHLQNILREKESPICFVPIELTKRMKFSQGFMKVMLANKLIQAGCVVKFWLNDWVEHLGHKFQRNSDETRSCGMYFIEMWKACGVVVGNTQFLWSSEEIKKRQAHYDELVFSATKTRISDIEQCYDYELYSASDIFSSCMRVIDASFVNADICLIPKSQEELFSLGVGSKSPLLLVEPQLGVLSSGARMFHNLWDKDLYMEDYPIEIRRKIKRAYCPPKDIRNPVLDYVRYIIFGFRSEFLVRRGTQYGGDIIYTTYSNLETDFQREDLHPYDLKLAVFNEINDIIMPIQKHFQSQPRAKNLYSQMRKISHVR
eukprot:CAMPEP_0114983802 /NCGR_PEP_ID=MMETSP0216-20121206/6906_1 /TAXON_ID=223996 /ORGANISM="Protocruzia adherens, Strain Boccale" /LENGTH=375 /DNA_ID=CAMNT_0002345833 /DNA_START=90 /DNA_END=1217 /DNA_ORIENTATION=+